MVDNTNILKVASVNVSGLSLRTKIALDKFVNDRSLDILALQETQKEDYSEYNLTNMKITQDNNKGAFKGCAIYIREDLTYSYVTELSSDNYDSIWIIVKIGVTNYLIGTAYINGSNTHRIASIQAFLKKVKEAKQYATQHRLHGPFVIGDFNCRSPLWGDTITCQMGYEVELFIEKEGFTALSTGENTFQAINGGSVIDLILTEDHNVNKVKDMWMDDLTELWTGAPTRGHNPIIASIVGEGNVPINNSRGQCNKNTVIDYNKTDWQKWNNKVEEMINQGSEPSVKTSETVWENLTSIFQEALTEVGTTKISSKFQKPFWNDKLSKLAKEARLTRKSYKRRRTPYSKGNMKQAKEELNKEMSNSIQKWIMDQTEQMNVRKGEDFWPIYQRVFNKKETNTTEILKVDDKIISKDNEKEEVLFDTFFGGKHMQDCELDGNFQKTVEEKLGKGMVEEEHSLLKEYGNLLQDNITIEELNEAIDHQKTGKKSIDLEGNHPNMIKHMGDQLKRLLLQLFNLSLETGCWPWKTSKVIFLKKPGKGSYNIPGNYRPITIASYFGKLMERILEARLRKYLEDNNMIDENQEGFRRKKNTVRYLYRLVNSIKIKIGKKHKKYAISLLVDMEKAFDSVWVKGLLYKLRTRGIKGRFLKLIENFLEERYVKLKVNGNLGPRRQTTGIGIPQGSVLSPLLFILFIAELGQGLQDVEVYKFADDASFVVYADSLQECKNKCQEVCDHITWWCKRWRFKVNCKKDKTEAIIFKPKVKNNNAIHIDDLIISNNRIKFVKKSRVLGLVIDENLTFDDHCKETLGIVKYRWYHIQKHNNREWGLKQKVLVQLFRTIILSKLLYCGLIWLDSPRNQEATDKFWYKALKNITGSVLNVSKELLEQITGIPPLSVIHKVNLIKFICKTISLDDREDPTSNMLLNTGRNEPPITQHLNEFNKYIDWVLKESIGSNSPSVHYTKQQMNKYTEELWDRKIKNISGASNKTTNFEVRPNTKLIECPSWVQRKEEVIYVSMMSKQNLFNSYLYKIQQRQMPSCNNCDKEAKEDISHIIFDCPYFEEDTRCIRNVLLKENTTSRINITTCENLILKTSRQKHIVHMFMNFITKHKEQLDRKLKETVSG